MLSVLALSVVLTIEFFNFWWQTIVPSTMQLSAMAAQMLIISPTLSLISAVVRNKLVDYFVRGCVLDKGEVTNFVWCNYS